MKMAKLYFRYGAMGCGKTAQLLQVAFNYKERGINVIVMKPKIDTKAGKLLSTRIGLTREIDYLIDIDESIYDIVIKNFRNAGCILIDESQFLTKSQVDSLMKITVELDIPVLCYGLRTNFLTDGFEGSTRLLEIAHTIEELKTICKCGRKAIFNARIIDGKIAKSGDAILIDENPDVKYVSMCAKCYNEQMNQK